MRSLGVVAAITLNTFRETVRDRVLYAIVIFALMATLAGLVLGTLSVQQDVRILEDLGLFAITIFGGLIAMFVGTNLVFKEIDKRTIYLLFTKPIRRWEFIGGKFLGLSLCLLVVCAAMGGFLFLLTGMESGDWSIGWRMAGSLGLMYVELVLVVALAIFFSTFATPLMSMFFTLGLWICGHLSGSLLALGKMSDSASVKATTEILYQMLPDLAGLTRIRGELLDGIAIPFEVAVASTAYILAYTVLLLAVATIITEEREFQ